VEEGHVAIEAPTFLSLFRAAEKRASRRKKDTLNAHTYLM
jgi:hypothetical protein